jgi:signal peptidase I
MADEPEGSVETIAAEGSAPSPVAPPPELAPKDSVRRQTLEFLILLGVGFLLLRTFAAEAYVVPTGSMAPTLLGFHKELTCPNCGFPFVVGTDDQGQSGRAVCPNCGQDGLSQVDAIDCNGDRLLVQKFLFDIRRPHRYEVAVFNSPVEPDQAYVKRVVGLPGEAVQITDGDLYIDGRIARKTLAEQRAMRILVFDNDYVPSDSDRFPRWRFRGDRYRRNVVSGWRALGTGFIHEPSTTSNDREDWLEYLHFDPDRGRHGPIRDFCPYNGSDAKAENVVNDLMIEAEVAVQPDVRSLSIRLDYGSDHFTVTLPVDGRGVVEARRNGLVEELKNPRSGLKSSPGTSPRFARLEASAIDRRLTVALDGVLLFDPIDFEPPVGANLNAQASPVALGVLGGSMEVRRVRIYRDIYYTGNLAMGSRRPFAVDSPYFLKDDEFFVLGDNSPISNDSRFWPKSPVVRGDCFLGKPFLVHLPGQVCPLKVFGRPLGWIPDPREIRYIR